MSHFKPWTKVTFTQPKLNADLDALITLDIACEGDRSTNKIDGPIDLRFQLDDSSNDRLSRSLDDQVAFVYKDGYKTYRNMRNYRSNRNSFILTTKYRESLDDMNYIEDKPLVLNLFRRSVDEGSLRIEVMEDGETIEAKLVVRPHPHIGNDLFKTISKCYHGQRHKESDNPQFVEDE